MNRRTLLLAISFVPLAAGLLFAVAVLGMPTAKVLVISAFALPVGFITGRLLKRMYCRWYCSQRKGR
ncbi:MAG: hypothetical protein IAF94_27020 [Pirellulaceae bacterium]|nr:hypothetical protein [Pirellulaceae bacterium]